MELYTGFLDALSLKTRQDCGIAALPPFSFFFFFFWLSSLFKTTPMHTLTYFHTKENVFSLKKLTKTNKKKSKNKHYLRGCRDP